MVLYHTIGRSHLLSAQECNTYQHQESSFSYVEHQSLMLILLLNIVSYIISELWIRCFSTVRGTLWPFKVDAGVHLLLCPLCLHSVVLGSGLTQTCIQHIFTLCLRLCMSLCVSDCVGTVIPRVYRHLSAYVSAGMHCGCLWSIANVRVAAKACAALLVYVYEFLRVLRVCRSPIYSWWGLVLWRTLQIWGPKLDTIICARVCVWLRENTIMRQ